MTIDLAATDFTSAITHDLCDQSCVRSTIYPGFPHVSVAARSQPGHRPGVTGDCHTNRTIFGSYDWLQCGQGATVRQCVLRYPVAVAYIDWSWLVVGHRTIGSTRGRTINNDCRRSMARSIVGNRATSV